MVIDDSFDDVALRRMHERGARRVLFDQFVEWVPDALVRQRILVDNPARLYGF